MFKWIADIINDNQGAVGMLLFLLMVALFIYFIHRGNRKDLEDFYRKYPKYDPKNQHWKKHLPSHN